MDDCHLNEIYPEGLPDEVDADRYEEQEDDAVFIKDGKEVFRVWENDVVSITPRGES